MTHPNAHDIKLLNRLVETTTGNAVSYRQAAVEAEDSFLRGVFDRHADARMKIAEDLKDYVRVLGGDPHSESSFLAKAQRAFLGVKFAIVGEAESVLDALEVSELQILQRYDHALEDKKISATTRETIRRAFAAIRATQEDTRMLKESLSIDSDTDAPLYPL